MSAKEIAEIEKMLEDEKYMEWLNADVTVTQYIRGEYLPDEKEWD